MRTSIAKATLTLAALALVTVPVVAQTTIHLNEIYISHVGSDDMEYVELIGTKNVKLTGFMVLVVEGDGSVAGTLDRAWDLSASTMPSDGYFVLGDSGISTVDQKFTPNSIENGTNTIYLVLTRDTSAVTKLVGTNVDPDGNGKTSIPSVATILDIIAVTDGGTSDKVYDGATVIGPDGRFGPAGIFRGGDYPNKWCATAFLDFDDVVNTAAPRTPGAGNVKCIAASATATGSSCNTSSGAKGGPALSAGKPKVGHSWTVTTKTSGSGAAGLLYVGLIPASPGKFLGCELYMKAPVFLVGGLTFTSGVGTLTAPVPNDSNLLGFAGAIQAGVVDAGILYVTNGVNVTIGY